MLGAFDASVSRLIWKLFLWKSQLTRGSPQLINLHWTQLIDTMLKVCGRPKEARMSDHDNSEPPRRRRSGSRSGSNFEAANSPREYPFCGSPNATRTSRAGSVSSVCSEALSEGGKRSLLEKTAGFGPARMEKMLTSHLRTINTDRTVPWPYTVKFDLEMVQNESYAEDRFRVGDWLMTMLPKNFEPDGTRRWPSSGPNYGFPEEQ
ncbi:hypothetical protein RvY_05424-1 [Ramazzottius varieornatus]|uniref:Uncharacterized protein n=1 Tax=Ramazzottius varieornatus TaxID=947166 RepID=A0A1D1UV03_RAMVA|nr:hypothetical protein RvY_05424-1 [Ramazzottius varieornatus]